MKHFYLFFLLACLAAPAARADEGGASPGGGDNCDRRLQKVGEEIIAWTKTGGPQNLRFDPGHDAAAFAQRMQAQAAALNNITCVGPGDEGFPVEVDGAPKECVNFVQGGKTHIRCDRDKAYAKLKDPENDGGQYKIMFHELASLAKLEPHSGPESTYHYSHQIMGFIGEKKMKFLSIKPVKQGTDLRLVKIAKSQNSSQTPGHCFSLVKKLSGYDSKDKLRLELSESRCKNTKDIAPIYRLKLYSSTGGSVTQEGLVVEADGLKDSMRALGQQVSEAGLRLQALYQRLQGADCRVVSVSKAGEVLGDEPCPFSDGEDDEAPATGAQPAN